MDAERVKPIVAGIFTIAIMTQFLAPIFVVGANQTRGPVDDTLVFGGDTQASLTHQLGIQSVQVNQSLGNTVRFKGTSDSYLEGSISVPHDGNWSVATWVQLDDSVDTQNATQHILQLDDWLILSYNQTEWRVWYYDDEALEAYAITINAPSPTQWTHLTVARNATHLKLWRNNSALVTLELAPAGGADILDAAPFHGRIEETRAYVGVINTTYRQRLVDHPTAPAPVDQTMRIYYDTYPGESTVDVFRQGTDLTRHNAPRVDGFDGQGAAAGTDYSLSGGVITALSGGTLDGAPAVFVQYTAATGPYGLVLGTVRRLGAAALTLAAVGVVVAGAALAISQYQRF